MHTHVLKEKAINNDNTTKNLENSRFLCYITKSAKGASTHTMDSSTRARSRVVDVRNGGGKQRKVRKKL